jgi:predicted acetyltransferase
MKIRKLKPEEHKAAEMLESLSFVSPMSGDTEKGKKEKPYQPDRWGCFGEDGQLAATLTNHDLPLYLDGGIAPARGVGGVASDPVSRGKGHVRALIEHVLKDDRKSGMLFSVLYPFSHPFYRKFGYELCYEHVRARFPAKALKGYRSDDPPQTRIIRPEDGTDALHPIYETFAKRYTFMIARSESSWQRHEIKDPGKAEKYCYILSRDGRDTAYAIFSFQAKPDQPYIRTLRLTEFAYTDHAAFNDLMGFLYRYTAQAETIELYLPEDLPIASLLRENYNMEYLVGPSPMARAVHVENILKMLNHPAEDGAYTIFIEDALLPENEGCYHVAYTKAGTVNVSRCEDEADMSMSVQTFSQLALGYLSLREAKYKPDVTIACNEDVLSKVFVQKAKFLLDWY